MLALTGEKYVYYHAFLTIDIDPIMKCKQDTYLKFQVLWALLSEAVVNFCYPSLKLFEEDDEKVFSKITFFPQTKFTVNV